MTRYLLFCFIAILPVTLAKIAHAEIAPADALFQLYNNDAEPVISEALAAQGAGSKVAATITGHDASAPLLSHNSPIEVEVHGLRFDEKTKRWNASLMAINNDAVVTAMPIAGRFEEVVSLPVLKRQLQSGNTIAEDDVEMKDFAVSRVRGEVVTEKERLVGQTPVRTLSSSRPVRLHEISGPVLVKKDSAVRMIYAIPGMEITGSGIAMEDGSKGKLIAVRNPDSKKTIHGVVTAEGTVSLQPLPTTNVQALSQEGPSHATN